MIVHRFVGHVVVRIGNQSWFAVVTIETVDQCKFLLIMKKKSSWYYVYI